MDGWTVMDKICMYRQCLGVLMNEVWIDRRPYIITMIYLYVQRIQNGLKTVCLRDIEVRNFSADFLHQRVK
jgi:hypothetical protein